MAGIGRALGCYFFYRDPRVNYVSLNMLRGGGVLGIGVGFDFGACFGEDIVERRGIGGRPVKF